MNSPILTNHVGYPCLAPKRFLIRNPSEKRFCVELLSHTFLHPVLEGELRPADGEFWEGDFSAVTAPGDYQITVGEQYSRNVVI